MFSTPELCDHVGDLRNGNIPRTSLLQPGQQIRTLPHGSHIVTGGTVHIGYLGGGSVTKVIGIIVNGALPAGLNYIPGFNHLIVTLLLFYLNYGRQGRLKLVTLP